VSEPVSVEHPGRTALLRVAASLLGRVGELHPRYLERVETRAARVLYADVDAAALFALVPRRRSVEPVERVPVVERDLAVVIDRSRPAGDVERLLRETAGALLRDLTLFDRYTGTPLGPDEVSLAYRLRLQARGRTLQDAEVDDLVARIVDELRARLGARIRS
jgi:phenylalanyl-tRNA synthetase beta chain